MSNNWKLFPSYSGYGDVRPPVPIGSETVSKDTEMSNVEKSIMRKENE